MIDCSPPASTRQRACQIERTPRKGTVESFAKLDADQIKAHSGWRGGIALAMELSPPVAGCRYVECVVVGRDAVALRYTAGDTEVHQHLRVVWRADPIAIQRPYFLCPTCGRTCRSLRGPSPLFACRACNRLNYRCQQTARSKLEALAATKIRGKLSAAGHGWPPRPKWMHWRTYIKLLERLAALEARQLARALACARRMMPGLHAGEGGP